MRRVGLVGCGRWGRHILRDLVALGCEVDVVARSAESRERARAGGATRILPAVESLMDVSGVVVATSVSTQADLLTRLLSLEVPLFTEKPLAADLASARRLAADGAGRIFVMDKWRYHPGILKLAEIARSGSLGRVRGLRTTRLQWRSNHRDADVVWMLLPHELAIAREVLGEVPPPRMAHADARGGFAERLLAVFGEEPWFVAEVAADCPGFERRSLLVCEDGVATLDDAYADHVAVCRAPGFSREPERERVPIAADLPLLRELTAFVGYLDGGPPPKSPVEEGLQVVETIVRVRGMAGL